MIQSILFQNFKEKLVSGELEDWNCRMIAILKDFAFREVSTGKGERTELLRTLCGAGGHLEGNF